MKVILGFALTLLLVANCIAESVEDAFKSSKLVPDLVSSAPTAFVNATFPSGAEVKLGNELTPTEVKDAPNVTWSKLDGYFTLALMDPDVFSRENPEYGPLVHWLVVNIPGPDVPSGEPLAQYLSAAPPEDTGLHRYTFLVYMQPGNITFDEDVIPNTNLEKRFNFSIEDFADKYDLGSPIGGNFFQAKYDDYVDEVMKQVA